LILDEPVIGLDPRQIVEIRNVIKNLGKKRTVILSSHILPEISSVCERVLVISNGKIIADGKPQNLAASVINEQTLRIRVAGPVKAIKTVLGNIKGVQSVKALGETEPESHDFLIKNNPDADIRRPLFRALSEAGFPILMLYPQNVSLEDVFLKLTEEEE